MYECTQALRVGLQVFEYGMCMCVLVRVLEKVWDAPQVDIIPYT